MLRLVWPSHSPFHTPASIAAYAFPSHSLTYNSALVLKPGPFLLQAMFIDFGLAKVRDGVCYLRYDDTNPAAERHEYIDHIQEIVRFMGWQPFKITYSSDYFP